MRITSFNCKNLKSSIHEVQQLCSVSDIVLLQETWLAKDELTTLNNVHSDFYGRGVSSMDTSSCILRGLPYGGLAVLWRKTISEVSITDMDDLMCIEVKWKKTHFALINVYLPVDNTQNFDDFLQYIAKINDFVQNYKSPYIAICGDFNANIQSNSSSRFGRKLQEYCHDENLVIADQLMCPDSSFTFLSEAHHSVSWLDHIVTTNNVLPLIKEISISYNYVSSDHYPIHAVLDMSLATAHPQRDTINSQNITPCIH